MRSCDRSRLVFGKEEKLSRLSGKAQDVNLVDKKLELTIGSLNLDVVFLTFPCYILCMTGLDSNFPKPTIAWFAVFVMMAAYMFSFIDRMILSLLVEPIKQDLQISDVQISLLQGFSFALFYTLQCAVAFLVAWQLKDLSRRPLRLATFAFLAVMCLLVFALGIPSG